MLESTDKPAVAESLHSARDRGKRPSTNNVQAPASGCVWLVVIALVMIVPRHCYGEKCYPGSLATEKATGWPCRTQLGFCCGTVALQHALQLQLLLHVTDSLGPRFKTHHRHLLGARTMWR